MRQVGLTSAKGGINRLRFKGSPRPDSLYDLVNGYVTASLSVKPRPGSVVETTLPDGTVGLTAFKDGFIVYASESVTMTDDRFTLAILRHPVFASLVLVKIHFAEPFLGYLYVVGEFNDGSVYHYWLQVMNTWESYATYLLGAIVQPTVPNGYGYQATRLGSPSPTWQANTQYYLGDIIEPTVPNGFYYTLTDTVGTNPISGATEPAWIATENAVTIEDSSLTAATTTPATGSTVPATGVVPVAITDRYGSGIGSGFGQFTAPE